MIGITNQRLPPPQSTKGTNILIAVRKENMKRMGPKPFHMQHMKQYNAKGPVTLLMSMHPGEGEPGTRNLNKDD